MSRRKFRHPQVIGQIILLSLVASHELSFSSAPLVGRLVIFGRGSQSGIIRSSQKTTLEILTQIDPSPHTRTTAESYVKPSNHHSVVGGFDVRFCGGQRKVVVLGAPPDPHEVLLQREKPAKMAEK